MRILIRELRSAADQTAAIGRIVDTERLRIGRGTDQDIELADLQLGLAYAELFRDGSRYRLRARSQQQFVCNGRRVGEAIIGSGDVVDCGRFRLSFDDGGGHADLTITIEERLSRDAQRSAQLGDLRLTLKQTLPMRALAWGAFLLVLLAFLVSPLLLRYAREAPPPRATLPALTDVAWTPGPISRPHAFFAEDCAQCHRAPFERTPNAACAACHGGQPHHAISAAALQQPEMTQMRCASCHAEHRGNQLVMHDQRLCADCHAEPQEHFAGLLKLGISDFGFDHPAFAPTLQHYDATRQRFEPATQRMGTQPLREDNGLRYPHDVHLDPRGIRAPEGKRVLQCASCHVPDARGVGFEKITMEKQCADCHRLDFDPDDPQRVVPHGKPEMMAAMLRDYYARKALAGGVSDRTAPAAVRERRRPGDTMPASATRAALDWADTRAQQTLAELYDRRVCRTCHEVARDEHAPGGWRVAPVQLSSQQLPRAHFVHRAHAAEDCTSCHAATKSKDSHDVLLPDIARCRDCHGGEQTANKVPSTCVMCHDFHRDGAPAMLPPKAPQAMPMVMAPMAPPAGSRP